MQRLHELVKMHDNFDKMMLFFDSRLNLNAGSSLGWKWANWIAQVNLHNYVHSSMLCKHTLFISANFCMCKWVSYICMMPLPIRGGA